MELDDFEQMLRGQPARKVPEEWRGEILAVAQSASCPRPAGWLSTINSQLSALLWPCPQAWAGLAAVWLMILAVNLATRDEPQRVAKRVPPPSPEMILALRGQKQLFTELIGPRETTVAERPKLLLPRPRSGRRDEILSA